MVSMSWKALLAARHCVATPVLLSRRENRSGAIGLSIDIFISYHNRYFNIVIFNIRVSIRVRGLHLVSHHRNRILENQKLPALTFMFQATS
jgi:hypothetical protein